MAHVELSSMHPNERLLRQEYEARAGRDDTSLADLFADDIVWHVPGRSTISGDYRGKEQVNLLGSANSAKACRKCRATG